METFDMPLIEMLKLLFNAGAFGLLAIIVVWLLFYGAPMLQNTLKYVVDKQETTADKLIASFEKRFAQMVTDAQEDRNSCRESRHTQANRLQGAVGEMTEEMRQVLRDELDRWGK